MYGYTLFWDMVGNLLLYVDCCKVFRGGDALSGK